MRRDVISTWFIVVSLVAHALMSVANFAMAKKIDEATSTRCFAAACPPER